MNIQNLTVKRTATKKVNFFTGGQCVNEKIRPETMVDLLSESLLNLIKDIDTDTAKNILFDVWASYSKIVSDSLERDDNNKIAFDIDSFISSLDRIYVSISNENQCAVTVVGEESESGILHSHTITMKKIVLGSIENEYILNLLKKVVDSGKFKYLFVPGDQAEIGKYFHTIINEEKIYAVLVGHRLINVNKKLVDLIDSGGWDADYTSFGRGGFLSFQISLPDFKKEKRDDSLISLLMVAEALI